MSLKDLPADARPREKLLARGAGALSDAELLALSAGPLHAQAGTDDATLTEIIGRIRSNDVVALRSQIGA